jgi:hypothetical protein
MKQLKQEWNNILITIMKQLKQLFLSLCIIIEYIEILSIIQLKY